MKIRCDLHVNGGHRKLLLVPQAEETAEHLGLKLAGILLFWDAALKLDISQKHPALADQKFKPDLVGFNEAGEVSLWVECGNVSLNKLDKLTRRWPHARLVVLKPSLAEGKRLRAELEDQVSRQDALEIWCWPEQPLRDWTRALQETVVVVGEVQDRSISVVINDVPVLADLAAV